MFRPALVTILVLSFSLGTLAVPPPAGAAQLSLSPADTMVTVGDTFTLRVVCDAVPDLKGFQSAYSFPSARLQFLAMPAGNVLTDAGGAWIAFVLPDVSAPADTAWIDAAMLDGSTQGPGVVAYIQFKALIQGDAPLQCVHAEIRDSNNVSLSPGCAAGVVHVIGPVPVRRDTWGRLKSLYR